MIVRARSLRLRSGQALLDSKSLRMTAVAELDLQTGLGALLQPPFQPASIFFQQKTASSKTLAKDAMRLRIACCARNPLLPHLVLAGRKPFLWQDLDQPSV